MARKLLDLRFAVRRHDGYVSDSWKLWITRKGDVYLANRAMARIEKYSFHTSGICRGAFTYEHGAPPSMSDRAILKWKRASTPPLGKLQGSRVAWLAFPTDYLSMPELTHRDDILWIPAAQEGGATFVEIFFTNEPQYILADSWRDEHARVLLSYTNLPNGEAVAAAYCHDLWDNNDIRMPGNSHSADLVFSAADPHNTGRPIRIRFGPRPTDGDALILQELGGYAVGQSSMFR